MKIAQVVCTYPPYRGGIGNIARDYNLAVLENGNESVVFTPQYEKSTGEEKNIKRIKAWLKFGNGAFIPGVFRRLVKDNLNIVHLHYPFFGGMEMVWLAKKLFPKKFKLIIHYHMQVGRLAWYMEILRLPSRLIDKSLFKSADIITCASIDYVLNNDPNNFFQDNQAKLYEIPFGADTKRFFPTGIKKPKQFLFVGGMDKAHYFKGVDILLKAFSQITDKDATLRLVGAGELLTKYQELARELKIENRVEFADNLNDQELVKAYQAASCLILPSINNNEAFGIVLLEAMACGTPVIATAVPGVRKVFHDGKEGYYFTPSNEKELAEKMKKILEMDTNILQKNCLDLIMKKYNSEILNQQLINLYQKINENRHN